LITGSPCVRFRRDCPIPNTPNTLSSPSPWGHILFVDDDADVLKAAELLLTRHGLRMTGLRDPNALWSVMAAEPVDVILLDLNFSRGAVSGEEGFRRLREIMAHDPDAVVVVVTGHSGVNVAVAAMRAGATDFVTKPWSNARLIATLETALELRRRRREAVALKAQQGAVQRETWGQGDGWDAESVLLGDSPAIGRVRDLIRRAAPTDAPVLIYGEPGTGKSLMARGLHRQSSRTQAPFISVDLGVLPAPDIETALFGDIGHGGSVTGAFVDARGGSIFLNELGALTPPLQARLLAVLETGRLTPPGLDQAVAVDVRLVTATRRKREELNGRGGLRADLLYRLNTVEISAPPLREREGDALLLAEHFLRLFAHRYGRPARPLSPEAAEAIAHDLWPGDVRALRQAMERCVILAEGERYEVADIPFTEPAAIEGAPAPPRTSLNLVESERALVAAALKRNSFNVSQAAKQLGLTRAALYRRMAKHGL
jgi:DNA-binding NtrC family response regulator